MRLVVKFGRWALDDVVLGAAYVGLASSPRAGDTLTIYKLIGLAQWAMIYTALNRGAGRSTSSLQPASLGTPGKVPCPTARSIRSRIDTLSLAYIRFYILDAAITWSHKV